MSFVYPSFLFALSLLAVPLIIHLFNFRRYKTVYFSNISFLKEIKEETAVRSRIKHWLVLASRLLALAFLVLAFSQPFIPVRNAVTPEGKRAVSIYIDNSFSMSAQADEEPLLNKAKRKAMEIVNAYDQSDRFQLLTNSFEGRQQRFVSKEEFQGMLDDVAIEPEVRTLGEVLAMQQKAFSDNGIKNSQAYWISDFQQNITDFKTDSAMLVSLVPVQPERQQNVYIDSCWLEKPVVYPGQPNRLLVKIVNTGESPVESSRLTLTVNGQVKALSDFSVPSANYTLDTVSFSVQEGGWKKAEASITDYPVTFDDRYFFAFNVTEQVNVLAINDEKESKFLSALYSHAEKFVFNNQRVGQLDYAGLRNYSLIVLNDLMSIPSGLAHELAQYLESGGAVVVFPNPRMDMESYNRFFAATGVNLLTGLENGEFTVTYLNKEHEIFQDVFENIPNNISLPTAKLYFKFAKRTQSDEQKLLGFRNGSSFISEYDYKRGKIYVCASPLDDNYTDFPVHAVFVPMLYKMALSGGSLGRIAYTLGKDEVIEVDNRQGNADEIYHVKGSSAEFIPRQKAIGAKVMLSLDRQVAESGIYEIIKGENQPQEYIAMNYDRSESRLDYYSPAQLKEKFSGAKVNVIDAAQADITGLVKEIDKGVILWKVCIILALTFLGAEVLLLRFLP